MLPIPDKSLFPGTGPGGNGMPEKMRSQGQWLAAIKTLGCMSCHQLGNKPTRHISKDLGRFDSSYPAWMHRLQIGPAAEIMVRNIGEIDTTRALRNFADWTDKIAAGALPQAKPARPSGVERNVVITLWDWADPKEYLHDEIATDKRNPTLNANGKIYGATEDSTDLVPVLDPGPHGVADRSTCATPTRRRHVHLDGQFPAAVALLGHREMWDAQTTPHNPMFDHSGRIWLTTRIRQAEHARLL